MLDAFSGFIFLTLILIGTVAICYAVMLKLLMPKNKEDYYIIIPQNSASKNARKLAYGTRFKFNLLGDECSAKIVVLDMGIQNSEKENLMEICKDSNGIYLVEKDYIKDFFDGRI